jgi:hypothetical protein
MIGKKILLYIETLSRLNPRQIFYRIYYILRSTPFGMIFYRKYKLFKRKEILRKINCNYYLLSDFFMLHEKKHLLDFLKKCKQNNELCFLNSCSKFNLSTWDLQDKSILWNYHLNYMLWLRDFLYLDVKKNQYKNKKYIVNVLENWVNFKSEKSCKPYPTSIRLIVWVQIISYYGLNSKKIISSFVEQYISLSSNIEFELDGNHILENYMSLYISANFLGLKNDILYYGKKLDSCVSAQFDCNGLHYERSFAYHFAILERLVVVQHMAEGSLDESLISIFSKSLNILNTVSNFEGVPLFHDSSHDMYSNVPYLKKILNNYDFNDSVDLKNKSNYLVLNHNKVRFILDMGDPSPKFQPAHYHCSMTSYTVDINNIPLIVDTGVYGYYEDKYRRLHSRRTSSHNVFSLNGAEQSNIWSIFRLGKSAKIISREVTRKKSFKIIRVNYLSFPSLGLVECSRVIILSLDFFGMIVVDLAKNCKYDAASYIVLNPSCFVTKEEGAFEVLNNGKCYRIYSPSMVKVVNHEVYKEMGVIEQTSKLIFSESVDNSAINSCVSYSVFDKEHSLLYKIKNNKISISNGVSVKLI